MRPAALRITRPRRRRAGLVVLLVLGSAAGGSAAVAAADPVAAGPRVIATAAPRTPLVLGSYEVVDVEVQNVGEERTSRPVAIRFDGGDVTGDGEDWTCSGSTCTLSIDLPAGATAPPLVVRRPVAALADRRHVQGESFAALVLGEDPGVSEDDRKVRATTPVVTGRTSDLAVAVEGRGPTTQRARRGFTVRVRNLGSAPSPGGIHVVLQHGDRLLGAAGDGWTCDAAAGTCDRPSPLAPGELAPAIEIVAPPPAEPSWSDDLRATVSGGGPNDDPFNDATSASLSVTATSGPQLVPTAEDAGASVSPDGAGRFLVRVRNVGVASSDGRISVALGRTAGAADADLVAGGDGWTCPERTGTCSTTGVVAPDAELPPLTVAVPAGPLVPAPRQTLHVVVSGGGDAEVRDNAVESTRVPDDAAGAGDVAVAIRNVRAGATNEPASADLVVRNPADAPRTAPTTIVVNVPADGAVLSGAGWTCTSTPRCTSRRAIPAGGGMPPIHVVWIPTLATPDELYPNRGPLRAGPAASEPFEGFGVASADVPVGRRGADPVITVHGPPPLRGGELEETRNVVRNVGTAPTRGRIDVQLRAMEDGASASGDGWFCDARSCSREDALAPGDAFPDLVTRRRVPAPGDRFSRVSGADLTAPDPADDVDRRNGAVFADAGGSGALPDLSPAIEDPRPEIGDRGASAQIVVRNAGAVDADGPVDVRSSAEHLDGDGWTCASGACRHPGPVLAGGRLPALRAEVDLPRDPYRARNRTITASLSNRSDGTDGNDEASVTVPAAGDVARRPLSWLPTTESAVDGSGGAVLDAVLRGRSAVPGRGPLRVRAVPGPGVTLTRIDVDGTRDVCDPTSCVVDLELSRLQELRVSVGVALAPGLGRGTVRLVARSADDGAEAAETDLAVTRPADVPEARVLLRTDEPATPTADAVVVAAVRNGGATTPGPVTVVLGVSASALRSAGGSGWSCVRDTFETRCRSDRAVPAGGALPPITLRTAWSGGASSVAVTGRVVVGRDSYANDASVTVPSVDAFGPGLLAAIDPVRVDDPGDPRGFDVRVRNADDRTTTAPIEVRLGAERASDGNPVSVTGPGWRCARGVCRHPDPLAPGETAAPIAYRSTSPLPGPYGSGFERYSASAGPGATAEAVLPSIPVAATDLSTSIVTRPATADAPAAMVVVASNLGAASTAGPVEVQLTRYDRSRPVRAGGPGWTCPEGDDVCRYDRPLAGGAVAAPLSVVAVGREQQFQVSVRDTGRRGSDRFTDGVYPVVPDDVPASTTTSDLTLDLDPLASVRPGALVPARLTVRNAGVAPHTGDVRVRLVDYRATYGERTIGRTASGIGWTCTDDGLALACSRPGPVAAGAALPPIDVAFPAPDRPTSLVDVTATVDDDSRGNDDVRGRVTVGASGRQLQVTVRGPTVGRAGEPARFSAEVRNGGTATVGEDAVVRFPQRPAGTVASGVGWSCDPDLVCRHAGPIDPGRTLPRLELVAPTPATAGAVVAAQVTIGTDPPAFSAPVSSVTASRAPRYVDLVPLLAAEPAPTLGRDDAVVLRVRNDGGRDATGTTTVRFDGGAPGRDEPPAPLPAGTSATGDGWSCSGSVCSTGSPVPAGTALPALRVTLPRSSSDVRGLSIRASLSATADQDPSNDATALTAAATAPTVAAGRLTSDVVSIGTASGRARPGERVLVQVPIAGRRPLEDRDARLVVRLPAALRFSAAGADAPAPSVDGRTVTWAVRTPADEEDRLVTFSAVVADDAAPGPARLTAALEVDGAAAERSETDLAISAPAVVAVSRTSIPDDRPTRLTIEGSLLRSTDRFELVGQGRTIPARETDGDDRRIVATFDACGAPAGSYALVVAPTAGAVLRLERAVEVHVRPAPRAPSCPAVGPAPGGGTGAPGGLSPGGSSGAPGGPAPAGGPSPAAIAALAAALGERPGPSSSRGTPDATRPVVRFASTPRAPRTRSLATSGWLVSVRTSTATALRAELVADRATARRLRVRAGTVLARATTGARAAGTVRLRLTVPAALRSKVRRATRISGTLRVGAVLGTDVATTSRRVRLRR